MNTMKFAACAAAVAGIALCANGAKIDKHTLISHRGESVDAPENTLPAYKTAVERGFGFECDIYLSADKRVFTFHDRDLTRTTAGACKKKCADANWETEISKADVGGWGKWKGSKFVGTRPALLEEVLKLAVDGRWIFVEVKPGPEIYRTLLERYRLRPEDCLFVDDVQQNVDGAVAVGMHAVRFTGDAAALREVVFAPEWP